MYDHKPIIVDVTPRACKCQGCSFKHHKRQGKNDTKGERTVTDQKNNQLGKMKCSKEKRQSMELKGLKGRI